jgi:hypothetical protein
MSDMETAQRQALVEQLRSCRDEFSAAASGLTDAQAAFKPAPRPGSTESWSIADCVEHVAVVEKGFFRWVTTSYKTDGPPPTPYTEAGFHSKVTDRTARSQAPEQVRPTGRFGSLAASLERFRAARDETIAYVDACQDDLHARTVTHLRLGVISCYQGLLFLVGHALRHAEQIREIKAAPGYPA